MKSKPSHHRSPIIRRNTPKEWGLSLLILAGVFQFFWTYHALWRGKPYSLSTASECIGFAALTGIAISLTLGPMYRLWKLPVAMFRLRRPLGVLGALLTLPHAVLSLFFLPSDYPLSFYVKNWSSLLLGAVALIGLLYLAGISRERCIARLGLETWKRRLGWASALLVLSVIHFVVLGKIPGWIRWAQEFEKMPPGSLLAFGIAAIVVSLRAWDWARRPH
jgi:DMSO/TMAO reductase YedYZ heme-binding membrane subunit